MKNITKKKIVLVTLSFLLGFSIPILTNSNKVDIQKKSLPKTNALTQTLLHSYDFEGDTVGQDPSGVTLSVIEPAGSGTANVDNLGDAQQNHVAVHKDGGTQRVELRDNISYYGNTFDAGVFHCKIYHDDSLFGILFYDDIGVLFRLDWFDGIIGRWSPYEVYTTYNYNQWYDVVVYFNISLGWMFEIDGVRFGDGYAYPFEHGGSGGLEWIRWCSAFSGGGNGFFRVDDVEFYYYEQISTVGFFDDFESGLSKWQSITGLWHLTDTGSAWPDPCHSPIHSMWFGDESTGTYDTGLREYGELVSIPFSLPGADSAFLEFYHWRAGEGGSYDVSYVYISIDGINWDILYQSSSSYIAPWEQVSLDISGYVGNPYVQLKFFFDTLDSISNDYRGWLVDDIMVTYEGMHEHELSVSLDTPMNPEIGNSYIINATVTNMGLNEEYDVDLLLYLDDIIVDSTDISSLPVDASETINYMWTPTEYKTYNFTAYAPPVPGETYIENNIATELIPIVDTKLFDGMYIDHTFNYMGESTGPSRFSYSYPSGEHFLAEWNVIIYDYDYYSYWDVGTQTRIMSNVGGDAFFSEGHHTPAWIFTDVSLGDTVPIAIMFGEEHIFSITNELIYDLPGFGLIEVWELEDLTTPGGVAWYEKSTGILLNGTFYFSGGSGWYTFDFIDTNALSFDHDLGVSLEVPTTPEINNPYIINATVTNTGENDEINVDLFLYLDDILVDSITISSLPVGASETINYMWAPTDLGEYNFSVYAPPVPGETHIGDNIDYEMVYVTLYSEISGPVAIFRNNLPWDMNVTEPILNMYGIDYTIYDSSNMGTVDLTQYEKVIIASDQDQLFYDTLGSYISWFESYASDGGILEIHGYDGGWHSGYWGPYYLMPGGIGQLDQGTDSISINILGHPIVNNPHIITDTELDGWSYSAGGVFDTYPSISKQILIDDNTLYPVFIELDFGEGTILATMQSLEWGYYQGYSNIIENVVLFNPDALLITTPDSSSEWETDTSHYIYWGSSGSISNVKLELYKDDVFVMEIISSTPNDGEYLWAIPSGLDDSAQYQIKISDVTNPATDDFSDYFEILTPVIDSLTVTTPDSLTAWEMGTSQDITWTSIGSIADVKIELYKDGVFEMEIIASTANDGSYNWGIPTDLEDGIDYQIRISDVLNPATYDESPNFAMTSADIPDEIPSYNLYIVIVIMCVVSVILLKKRFKLIK